MITIQRFSAYILFAALCVFFAPGTLAQSMPEDEIAQPVNNLAAELDILEKQLIDLNNSDEQLKRHQARLESIIESASSYRLKLAPTIDDLKSQIAKLGPKPEKDSEPEADGIASERERLGKLLGRYDTTVKKAKIVETRSEQLIRRIQDSRRALFADETLKRWRSPLDPSLWRQLYIEAPFAIGAFRAVFDEWIARAQPLWRIFFFVIPCIGVWIGLRWISLKIRRHLSTWRQRGGVPFFRRAVSAVIISIARMVPAICAVGLFYFYLSSLDTFTPQTDKFAQSIVFAFSVFVMIWSLARTLLAPKRSDWRMFAVSDPVAERLCRLVQITAIVYAVDIFWLEANEVLQTPLSLTLIESFIASSLFAFLFIAILLTPFRDNPDAEADMFREFDSASADRLWPWWLKIPLWVMALAILMSAVLGYMSLANFLAGQVLVSGAILVMALLVYMAIDEFCEIITHDGGLLDGGASLGLRYSEPRRRQISALLLLLLKGCLLLVVLPLILLQWGFAWADLRGWLLAAFFGFKFGPIELSLFSVFIAIAIFFVGVALTGMLQRWLKSSLLRSPPMKPGVAHSLNVGIGYLGYLLSALFAFSYTGFDLTNVAIVAGALSVGIGFGLQSIVNNFVSGLILLVERPIRVGDWVIVGDHQGHVRRISVRSTEIETFDRSTVIVPNSDLITSTVVNWTHGNTLGRITIPIGVSYDSDAKQVYELLQSIAKGHEKVLADPAPLVVFEDFGASSLDFTLRIYVGNIRESLSVQTDLRLEILEAFRKENIEIPFPQRDVHIKSDTGPIEGRLAPESD